MTKRLFRADPNDLPRHWMRRHWRLTTALGLALGFLLVFDAWLFTCGFEGCPSPKAIRAYQPPPAEKFSTGLENRWDACTWSAG